MILCFKNITVSAQLLVGPSYVILKKSVFIDTVVEVYKLKM